MIDILLARKAAVEVEQRLHVIGVAVEHVLLVVARSLADRAEEDFGLLVPAEVHARGICEVDGRQIRDAILLDGLVLELLAIDRDVVDLADVRRLAVRGLDFLLDVFVADEVLHAIALEPFRRFLDVERLAAVAVRIDIECHTVIWRLLDNDAVVRDLDGCADFDEVEDVLDVFLIHADAAIRDVMADGLRLVRAVDAVIALDFHPAVTERVALARRDGILGICRIRPRRVEVFRLNFEIADRRRRRSLARADGIEADALLAFVDGERAGCEVDADLAAVNHGLIIRRRLGRRGLGRGGGRRRCRRGLRRRSGRRGSRSGGWRRGRRRARGGSRRGRSSLLSSESNWERRGDEGGAQDGRGEMVFVHGERLFSL